MSEQIEFLPIDALGEGIQGAIDELVEEGVIEPENQARFSRISARLRRREPAKYDGFCARACQAYVFLARDSRTRALAKYPEAEPRKDPEGDHYWLQTESGGILDLNFAPSQKPNPGYAGYRDSVRGHSPGFNPSRSDPTLPHRNESAEIVKRVRASVN